MKQNEGDGSRLFCFPQRRLLKWLQADNIALTFP